MEKKRKMKEQKKNSKTENQQTEIKEKNLIGIKKE